jgi:hypothetical protein
MVSAACHAVVDSRSIVVVTLLVLTMVNTTAEGDNSECAVVPEVTMLSNG